MANNYKDKDICKSVFKNGKSTTSKKQFTWAWVDLINNIEKYKNINFAKRQ